jgi:phage terminase small subunit
MAHIPQTAVASPSSDSDPSRESATGGGANGGGAKKRRQTTLPRQDRLYRRARFCEEYLANGHKASAAAVAVGYAEGSSARGIGHMFLAELKASGELAAAARQRAEAAELETVRTLREVARIAYGDVGRLFDADGKLIPLADLDEDVRAIVAWIELWPDGTPKKIKLWSKIEALDMAMRHAGLFERDNRQSQQNMILQVELVDPPKREG